MKLKPWVVVSTIVFIIGFSLGLATPSSLATVFANDSEGVMERLNELAGRLTPFSINTAIIIFLKNVSALAVSFALAPLFLLMPLLALVANGWLLAFAGALIASEKSLLFVIAGILPHGIIELPAFVLGEAAALSFGSTVLLGLIRRRGAEHFIKSFKQNRQYLFISVALLAPAALVETYITPLLIR